MAQITGLDIGQRAIRAAVLDGGRKLVAVEEIALGPGADPWAAVKELTVPRKHVWVSLNDRESLARDMRVPFIHEDQIKQTIRFSAEEVISDDVENYLLDHHIIEIEEAETHLMIVAARRDAIGEKLQRLQEAGGVDPDGLGVAGLALYNLGARLSEERDSDDPFLILDVGSGTADVIVGDRDHLWFVRSIIIHREGDDETTALDEERLDRLFREVRRTLWSGGVDGHAERIWICGGLSLRPGIVNQTAAAFDLPAEIMPVEEVLDISEAPGGPLATYAQAIGLAMQGSGAKLPFAPNFRREEFVRQPILLKIRVPAFLLLLVLMGAVFWDGYQRLQKRNALRQVIASQIEWEMTQYADLLAVPDPDDPEPNMLDYTPDEVEFRSDPEFLLKAYEEASEDISRRLTVDADALESLREVTRHITSFKDLELESLSISRTTVTLRGTLPNASRLQALEMTLQADAIGDEGYFRRLDVRDTVKEDVIAFTLTLPIRRQN